MHPIRRNLTRLTVAGSTAALGVGLAVPALACLPAGAGVDPAIRTTSHPVALTAAGLQARVDASLTARLAALAAESARIAASTKLTAAQKSAAQARIAAAVGRLTALKAAVDAETTVAAIRSDLAAAWLADLKSEVDARIAARLGWLQAAAAHVQASTTLTAAQKAAKLARLESKVSALTALAAKVDGETSAKAVLADLRTADALWLAARHDAASGKGADRAKVAIAGAGWHKVADPRSLGGARFGLSGRGHASCSAGQHGFGASSSGASSGAHVGHGVGPGHR